MLIDMGPQLRVILGTPFHSPFEFANAHEVGDRLWSLGVDLGKLDYLNTP